jgi:hypothetical protein
MKMGRKIFLLLLFLRSSFACCSVSDSNTARSTPFDPRANFQTIGIIGRIIPRTIGNAGGLNCLAGAEVGFLKRHSISVPGFLSANQDHRDNYFGPNDPRYRESNLNSISEK